MEEEAGLPGEGREELYRGLFEGSPDAILVADAGLRCVAANHAAAAMLGYPREQLPGMNLGEKLAAGSDRAKRELALMARRGQWRGALELRGGRGGPARVEARASLVNLPGGDFYIIVLRRMTGRASMSEMLRLEEESARLAQLQAEASERRYRQLADFVPHLIWATDSTGWHYFFNRRWYEYTGLSEEESLGFGFVKALHADDKERTLATWERAWRDGESYNIEYRLYSRGQRVYRWFLGRAMPTEDANGQVISWFGSCTDIDDQKRYEESLKFLSEASRALGSSLDYHETLKTVARLAVPAFADWCAVDVLEDDGSLGRLAAEHVDAKKVDLAHEISLKYPPDPERPDPIRDVLATGKPRMAGEIPDSSLEGWARSPGHLKLLRGIGVKSFIIVPLVVRGRAVGAISFVMSESGRAYTDDDLTFAQELAARAALAVDNASLYHSAQDALDLHRAIEERLQLLAQASDTLIGSPMLSEVLTAILAISQEMVAADAYAVWRLDDAKGEWQIVNSSGLSEDYSMMSILLTQEGGNQTLDRPLVTEDVESEPRLATRRDMYRAEKIVSLLTVPLKIHGKFSGTIAFYYRKRHHFSELEKRVAMALANMAAAAISTAELYEEQMRMRKEAEEANRTKDEFLATVSHELRTPLNAILGWTQLMRRGRLDKELLDHAIETIERNAKLQSHIVEDILDVSRIITGKLRLEVKPVDLGAVIGAAVETIRPAAEAKEIRIEAAIDSAAGPVSGDANRLQQVVWNMLSNAVKFTPKAGSIRVRLGRVGSQVEITVSDTGSGINPEFLPYVFDRFSQADGSTSRAFGGLGLGLAIVRHIVELHGGTVDAFSEGIGKGATLTVRLPITVGAAGEHYIGPPQISGEPVFPAHALPSLAGLKVLIVDDEADAREVLKAMLTTCGAEVLESASAGEAFDAVTRLAPDIIVSDIGMPDEDGYNFIRRVRALGEQEGGRVPAVALTAYTRTEDRIRALQAGYQVHVPKPVELPELAAAIASLTGRTG